MQQVTPADTTVARLCRDLGFELDDERVARQLERGDVAAVLERLRQGSKPIDRNRSARSGRRYTTGVMPATPVPLGRMVPIFRTSQKPGQHASDRRNAATDPLRCNYC